MSTLPAAARNAVPCVYAGRRYRSTFEARYAEELDLRQRIGEVTAWEYEPRVTIRWPTNGRHITTVHPDFLVTFSDGHQEFHECKGWSNDRFAIVRKLLEASQEIPLVVIRDERRKR